MNSDLRDFIRTRIRADIENSVLSEGVVTRFPPEPNGFLHIGHAKSICLNFGVANEFNGHTYLRFDDTNPLKESDEFVEAIQEDVRWLGFDWADRLTFASDYFDELYEFARELIRRDRAFVCDLSADEIRETRGSLTEVGTESPFRDRSIAENLDLFERMKNGDLDEGACVLRAKIDMKSPNINLRDPVLYRIIKAEHHRTSDKWCIYPMYDFTHCICDALENITHSLCTLEFEDHRPLYDWVLDNININFHPPQIEFSRLSLEYNVMSKRILTRLIDENHVDGWNDPRLPTIAGLRRRGVPAAAIREFCNRIGVTKQKNLVETELLDFCVRQELENSTKRGMAILDPLPVEIVNFDQADITLGATWHPKDTSFGSREIKFGRKIFIERNDFQEVPEKGFRRLTLGGMVRLRYGFIIRCDEVVKNDSSEIVGLKASYFPESRSGADTSGLKPKGIVHFVAESNATPAQFRLFEKLFTVKEPGKGGFNDELNSRSLTTHSGLIENAVLAEDIHVLQFERTGYFCRDFVVRTDQPVFNRIVSLTAGYKKNRPNS